MKWQTDLLMPWEVTLSSPKPSRSFSFMPLTCEHPSYANILERLVAEARAPKSTAPPTKSGSFSKLAFNHDKMLNAEGLEGSEDVEPPNH
jgi:hypothetical protein